MLTNQGIQNQHEVPLCKTERPNMELERVNNVVNGVFELNVSMSIIPQVGITHFCFAFIRESYMNVSRTRI